MIIPGVMTRTEEQLSERLGVSQPHSSAEGGARPGLDPSAMSFYAVHSSINRFQSPTIQVIYPPGTVICSN